MQVEHYSLRDVGRDDKKVLGCKAFVDSGLWDRFYRKD
ncbi:hypothetical protein ES708_22421 [subsurface metagenome]